MEGTACIDCRQEQVHPGSVKTYCREIADPAATHLGPRDARRLAKALRNKCQALVGVGFPDPVARDLGDVAEAFVARGDRFRAIHMVVLPVAALFRSNPFAHGIGANEP